ncbi:MAG: pilin [Candidatus Portnoybacteria bacterium]|nr:pilin [Candidatus Portnoybacteria bacterium]
MKNFFRNFLVFSLAFNLIFSFSVFCARAQEEGATSLSFSGNLAQLAPTSPGTGSGQRIYELDNPLKSDSFEGTVEKIAEWIRLIAIPIASIMILYAGFLFMTSGGNEEKVKTAKRTLLWTVIGIAIIIIGSGFITLIKDILTSK